MGYRFGQSLVLSGVVFGVSLNTALSAENFAVVQSLHGKVLVNHGQGFAPAHALMGLKIGDRVLVSQNSSISFNYLADGCASMVDRPSLFKITKASPCGAELISSSVAGAPIVAPGVGSGVFTGVAGAAALPVMGWAATQVFNPIGPASLP